MRRTVRLVLPAVLVVALLGVIWEVYARTGELGDDVLPPLSRVLTAGWDDRASLWASTLPTLREVVLGFAVAVVFAFAISILLDASGLARRSVMPTRCTT